MSKDIVSVVEVKLPISEFVDRYLISVLKLNKFIESGKSNTQELQAWINGHNDDYQKIIASSQKVQQASDDLAIVHEKLWSLEDLVRSPEAEQLDYFAKVAKQIFALNTDRHKLKHAIDQELPSLAFGPRLYDKGIE